MAKQPKVLSEKDFPKPKPLAFRQIPTKENYLKPDEKHYFYMIEFRPDNTVVCQPVGDTRYNYYMPLAAFDPKDFIVPDAPPPVDVRLRDAPKPVRVAPVHVPRAAQIVQQPPKASAPEFNPMLTTEGQEAVYRNVRPVIE